MWIPVHAAFVLNGEKAPESTGLGAQILHASTHSTLAEENGRLLNFRYRSLALVARVNVLKDSVEFECPATAVRPSRPALQPCEKSAREMMGKHILLVTMSKESMEKDQ